MTRKTPRRYYGLTEAWERKARKPDLRVRSKPFQPSVLASHGRYDIVLCRMQGKRTLRYVPRGSTASAGRAQT